MIRLFRWVAVFSLAVAAHGQPLVWQPWSKAVFSQAQREHKFVLLDLEAVWCHWCHVMDETTYRDPEVAALLYAHFLLVRVDQDSRPDLASRYEDYGWPATVVYSADGTEIVKKQGYIPPAGMVRLLKAIIDDPSPVDYHDGGPEASAATGAAFSADRRTTLRSQWLAGYDDKAGGWGRIHKYLDPECVELALRESAQGDEPSGRHARETLRLERRLLDPVWGGVYQYSVGGDWNEPHFEKIISMQAGNLEIYSRAYAQWGDPAYLETAQAIRRYLKAFLTSPAGTFYVSQDADLSPDEPGADYFHRDDAGRRALGIPRVDAHVYARENGWTISALVPLYEATGDASALKDAETAALWIVGHRALAGGGFRHGEDDAAGPYLGDTLTMGRAFLGLYQATADPAWLSRAVEAGRFIGAHFIQEAGPGFATSDTTKSTFPKPRPEFGENVFLLRFAEALSEASGMVEFRAMASNCLRWLLSPGLAETKGYSVAGLLLGEEELRTDPLHIMIVGRKDDPVARELFSAALRVPTEHKLIEWWDRREGPPPRGEAIYPDLPKAAAFVCDHGACSSPIFSELALAERLKRLGGR